MIFVNKKVKIIIRILAILCLLSLILPFVLTAKAADTSRYGYSLLRDDKVKLAYEKIADGIKDASDSINLTGLNLTQDHVEKATEFVHSDFPEYFWFTGAYNLQLMDTGSGMFVTEYIPAVSPSSGGDPTPGYQVNGQVVKGSSTELANAKSAFNAVVNEAMSKIPAGASDYQKSEILHDFVDDKTEYQQVGDHQSAYGALVLGKAVCAGYARAYQVLMNAVGIRCWYVSGESKNPSGIMEAHAWNLVWLDGKCVYTDVTWDDHRPTNFHHYLNLSLDQISTDHHPSQVDINGDGIGDGTFLPASCGHNTYTYFKMNSGEGKGVCDMTGSESGADVAKYFVLKSQNGDQVEYFCRVHYHGGNFADWMNANSASLIEGLNLTGSISIQQEYMGIEYQVTLTGTAKNPVTPPPPETQPVTPPPASNPAQTQPAETQPSQTQPVETQPPQTQPQQTTPATTTPETTAPAGNEGQTATTQPATTPATTAPVTTQPSGTATATGSSNGTTAPVTDTETKPSDGSPVLIIVIITAVLLAGAGAVVYFLKFRKKTE